jgi:hypothetical protein
MQWQHVIVPLFVHYSILGKMTRHRVRVKYNLHEVTADVASAHFWVADLLEPFLHKDSLILAMQEPCSDFCVHCWCRWVRHCSAMP